MAHLTDDIGRALTQPWPQKLDEVLEPKSLVCSEHGDYMATGKRILICRPPKDIWTSCPKCEVEKEDFAQRAAAEARAARDRAHIEEMLQQTALPSRFVGRTLDNYQATTEAQIKALNICRRYVDRFDDVLKRGSCLIMSGLPGTGKSHLAGGILQAILPRHVGVYVTMMDLIRMLRNTWRKDSDESETDVLARLAGVSLLVIDEVGVQYGTDSERTLFFDVMDRRYRDCMPTILMTNQGMADLRVTIGDRVYDRLTEVAKWIAFDWPSHRTQMRKEFQS